MDPYVSKISEGTQHRKSQPFGSMIYDSSFIDDLPIKNGDFPVREPFNNQRVPLGGISSSICCPEAWCTAGEGLLTSPWDVVFLVLIQELGGTQRWNWMNYVVTCRDVTEMMVYIWGFSPKSLFFRLVNYYNSARRNIFMAKNGKMMVTHGIGNRNRIPHFQTHP